MTPPPQNQDDSLIGAFPLSAIRSLLYLDERLESIQIQSKVPGDTACVKIIPRSLGEYLRSIDVKEQVFHLELFETHAEVWLAFEWCESNARRLRLKDYLTAEKASMAKHNQRMSEILSILPPQMGDAWNQNMASIILKEYQSGNYNNIINILKMQDKLDKFKREDEEQTI